MATIRKRNGNWTASVRRKGYDPKYGTFDTKTEAQDWAKDIEIQMRKRVYFDTTSSEKTTLEQLLERYSEEVSVLKKGVVQEQSKIRMILKHSIVEKKLIEIDSSDLVNYRKNRLKGYDGRFNKVIKSVGDKTTREELQILNHAFKIAKSEWGFKLPDGNPCDEVTKPAANKGARDRRLKNHKDKSLCEETLLLQHAKTYGKNMADVITFAIETAMRRGELAKLEWQYVDLDIRIAHLQMTKNGKKRDVPLSTKATKLLHKLKTDATDNNGSVFGLLADYITHAFIDICKEADITNLKFHDLRHEATSRLFELGLNPLEVATITGHEDLQMLKRYTHLRGVDLVNKLK